MKYEFIIPNNCSATKEENMEKKKFFSIIIPVYKAEKFLNRCVSSILQQSFEFFELILVDDGSPDTSGELCDKIAQSDSRVVVLHKDNGGASSARNAGIRVAQGEYLMFVDSDDFWDDLDGLRRIYQCLVDKPVEYLRMACTDEYVETGQRVKSGLGYDKTIFEEDNMNHIINRVFSSGYQPGAAWTAIIRRDVVVGKNLFFVEGIKGEDIDWILKVFLNVNSINFCEESFYIYQKGRADSVTGTADLKSIRDILWIIDYWSEQIQKEQYKEVYQTVNTFLAYHLMCTVILYKRLSLSDRKKKKKEIAQRKHVLRNLNRLKVRVAVAIYQIFGIEIASFIMNLLH